MNEASNIVIILIFGGLGTWLLTGYLKTKKQITVKDKSWNFSRIVFAVAGVMSIVTIIFCQTVLDFVRLFATEFCIIMFLLQRDGIGEEGVVSLGQFFSYKDVKAYDVHEAGKKTNCLFMVEEKGAKKTSEYTLELSFAAKDTETIKTLLKNKIGKKYRRMKR